MADTLIEKFNTAESYYEKAVALLNEISQTVVEVAPDYDTEGAIAQYDAILQAVLLATAIKDNTLEENEVRFISQITSTGDILLALNSTIASAGLDYEKIEWSDLRALVESSDDDKKHRIVRFICSLAYKISGDFIKYYAPVDELNQRDFKNELTDLTLPIIMAFCEVDGESMESDFNPEDETETNVEAELGTGVSLFRAMLVDRWEEAIAEFTRSNPETQGDDAPSDAPSDTEDDGE